MNVYLNNKELEQLDTKLDKLIKEQDYFKSFIKYINNLEDLYIKSEIYDRYNGFNKNIRFSTLRNILNIKEYNYNFDDLVNIAHTKILNLRLDNAYALSQIDSSIEIIEDERLHTILDRLGYK